LIIHLRIRGVYVKTALALVIFSLNLLTSNLAEGKIAFDEERKEMETHEMENPDSSFLFEQAWGSASTPSREETGDEV